MRSRARCHVGKGDWQAIKKAGLSRLMVKRLTCRPRLRHSSNWTRYSNPIKGKAHPTGRDGPLAKNNATIHAADIIRAPDHDAIEHSHSLRVSSLLVRIPEAAQITGLPSSILRKSFMREERRPPNVPAPPPHKRIGRAIYIFSSELPAWLDNLGKPNVLLGRTHRTRRGRPTVAERIIRRQHEKI
jgi:hypothetical protein